MILRDSKIFLSKLCFDDGILSADIFWDSKEIVQFQNKPSISGLNLGRAARGGNSTFQGGREFREHSVTPPVLLQSFFFSFKEE